MTTPPSEPQADDARFALDVYRWIQRQQRDGKVVVVLTPADVDAIDVANIIDGTREALSDMNEPPDWMQRAATARPSAGLGVDPAADDDHALPE